MGELTQWADVSEWQGAIDWRAYGAQFPVASARAHNGYRADTYWISNRDGIRAHCKGPRLWYQYLAPNVDAALQAELLASTLSALLPGEIVMLDHEDPAGTANAIGRAYAWRAVIEGHYGPGSTCIYSSASWFRVGGPLEGIDPQWPRIAASISSATAPDAPEFLRPGVGETGWQWSFYRPFPGIAAPCDGNRFDGTPAQMAAAFGAAVAPKPKPVPIPELEDTDMPLIVAPPDKTPVTIPVPSSYAKPRLTLSTDMGSGTKGGNDVRVMIQGKDAKWRFSPWAQPAHKDHMWLPNGAVSADLKPGDLAVSVANYGTTAVTVLVDTSA